MGLPIFGCSRTLVCDWKRGELKHLTYPQEKKAIAIPLVRATEKGTGQTESVSRENGDVGFGPGFCLTLSPEVFWKEVP